MGLFGYASRYPSVLGFGIAKGTKGIVGMGCGLGVGGSNQEVETCSWRIVSIVVPLVALFIPQPCGQVLTIPLVALSRLYAPRFCEGLYAGLDMS